MPVSDSVLGSPRPGKSQEPIRLLMGECMQWLCAAVWRLAMEKTENPRDDAVKCPRGQKDEQ